MRLLHTMLRVGNLQRAIDFYTKVLGMTLLRTSENPEYKCRLWQQPRARRTGTHLQLGRGPL